MNRLIGFSTGVLFKEPMGLIDKIEVIRDTGCRAIELAALKVYQLFDGMDRLTPHVLEDFEYVSLHAPTFEYDDNDATRKVFEKILWINSLRSLNLIVVHPNTVKSFHVFNRLTEKGVEVAFENMDNKKTPFGDNMRKLYFANPRGFDALLAHQPECGFVLDIAHVFSADPTLKLAEEFARFADKIVEIHLSGYNGHHAPLYETEQIELIRLVGRFAKPDTPIIIESVLPLETMKEEMDYILHYMD